MTSSTLASARLQAVVSPAASNEAQDPYTCRLFLPPPPAPLPVIAEGSSTQVYPTWSTAEGRQGRSFMPWWMWKEEPSQAQSQAKELGGARNISHIFSPYSHAFEHRSSGEAGRSLGKTTSQSSQGMASIKQFAKTFLETIHPAKRKRQLGSPLVEGVHKRCEAGQAAVVASYQQRLCVIQPLINQKLEPGEMVRQSLLLSHPFAQEAYSPSSSSRLLTHY